MQTDKTDFLDRLAELRSRTCDAIPTPQLAVLVRLTARLRRSGMVEQCLQVGESVPNVEVRREAGAVRLHTLLESGPVVINFFRGLWCPYCTTELDAYASVASTLESLGVTYLAVSPQKAPASEGVASGYAFISDEGNAIARRFKLVYRLEPDERALLEEWGVGEVAGDLGELPLPATYLIAPDATVAFRFVDADFRSRLCPDDLLREVRSLGEEIRASGTGT